MRRRIAIVLCAALTMTATVNATSVEVVAVENSSDSIQKATGSLEDINGSADTKGSADVNGSADLNDSKGSADFDLFQGERPSQVMRTIMLVLGVAVAVLTFFGIFGAQIANLFGIRL